MFDYIVRHLLWTVEGENKVSLYPVVGILSIRLGTQPTSQGTMSMEITEIMNLMNCNQLQDTM